MGRLRIVALALLAVVALVAAAAWFWRDLPRRKVESALEDKLSATVGLGRLEIVALDRFVFHDLEVRRVAGQPRLVPARVKRLEADGDARAMLEGRFDRLALGGVEVRSARPIRRSRPRPPDRRCGKLMFDVRDAEAMGVCHCTRCTRWTGSAGSAVVVVAAKNFNVTQGRELMKLFREEKFADRYFCSNCGSGIYTDGGDNYYVAAGVLRDLELNPAFHIQVAYKAPWDETGGNAPQFPEYPPHG